MFPLISLSLPSTSTCLTPSEYRAYRYHISSSHSVLFGVVCALYSIYLQRKLQRDEDFDYQMYGDYEFLAIIDANNEQRIIYQLKGGCLKLKI